MDLIKNGKLLCDLRKAKGMTQKQLADILGIVPKTVSKWETGRGFPDISTLSALSEILGVSEKTLLSGSLTQNAKEVGNMKRIKFFVCPHCGSFMQTSGNGQVICCGKPVDALTAKQPDDEHSATVSQVETDYYVEFNHPMTKDHFISFVAYVCFDRVLTVRLYPEQDSYVRFPKTHRGKLYYYCNKHGLYEHK